jgi:hypothetical protein
VQAARLVAKAPSDLVPLRYRGSRQNVATPKP